MSLRRILDMSQVLPLADDERGSAPKKVRGFEEIMEKQKGDYLCWAAVTVSTLKYRKLVSTALSQCDLADIMIKECDGKNECGTQECDKPVELVNTFAKILELVGVVIPMGNGKSLKFPMVKDMIDEDRPIVCEVDGGRHAVVIYGYDSSNIYQLDPKTLDKNDSWAFGTFKTKCYQYFPIP